MEPQNIVRERGVSVAWRPPFAMYAGAWRGEAPAGSSILQMVLSVPDLPREFMSRGVVLVNGEEVPRALWALVRPKLGTERLPIAVTLHLPLGGGGGGSNSTAKSVGTLVAALALVVITGGIASAGVPFLGIAGGSVGASVLSGAVPLAGKLGSGALR